MENKIREYLNERLQEFYRVVLKYPVEMGYALLGLVLGIYAYEVSRTNDLWGMVPLLMCLAYILNKTFPPGSKYSVVYYLAWVPAAVLFIPGVDYWIFSRQYFIALGCLLLAVPVFKGRRDNTGFVAENWWFFSGVVVALALSAVAALLFSGLAVATMELFNIGNGCERLLSYFAMFSFSVVFTLLALSYFDRHENTLPEKTGVLAVLLYYIVSPAIIAFNILFYAYIIKIIIQWSLPNGYVALMVFNFALLAFLGKALRELLPRKRYGWYYDRLSLIALPAVVLFWVGVVYRVAQYGLTESRVYLVLSGIVMTVTIAMFVCHGKGSFRWASITGIVLFGLFSFVRPISAERIGLISQERRLVRLATQLDLLESPDKLKEKVRLPDNEPGTEEKLHQLREALRYVSRNGGHNYGVPYSYYYGDEAFEKDYVENTFYVRAYSSKRESIDLRGFSHMIRPGYLHSEEKYVESDNDRYLRIYCRHDVDSPLKPVQPEKEDSKAPEGYVLVWEKSLHEVGWYLLDNAGVTAEEIQSDNFIATGDQSRQLTRYEDERVVVLFNNVSIRLDDMEIAYIGSMDMVFVKR